MNLLNQHAVSLQLARRLVVGTEEEATKRGVKVAIVVVDRAGDVVAVARMDGVSPVATRLALDKAFTAAAFGAPTHAWAAATAPGGADWGMANSVGGRIVVLPGGLPLVVEGETIGGIGVSGAAPDVDLACASAGVAATDDVVTQM